MKKILVTGGAGFIGSHVVDALVERGHGVVVIDDLSSGTTQNINKQSTFVEGDITNARVVEKLFATCGPFDAIIHLAAQKSVTASVREPKHDANINIMGSLTLCEAAQKYGVKRIIFSSTGGALYGDGVALPTPEDARIEPLSPYGIAKLSIENYLRFYRETGMTTQILRYANVYGPRQDPHGEAGVVAIFCQKCIAGTDLTIFGDGTQTRDFIYVGDVVDANIAALKSASSGTWNIGTGKETSVNDLACGLIDTPKKSSSKIIYAPARMGELKRSCLAITKAKKELMWDAQVSLADGLKNTYDSFR
ncbi:UDP-glucose 4-epimerase [Candidatus Berkelbacteria bacterium CG10_big_fil_rev_8_21_14_0_10_43_14]|uniref:UDP-glucose 4-epimerase n=1 Tax=Candidatus Berkelbacteria bacterium CG10_big_fil_rev_8_21_14_0_10_43_14 TaxID=1974515 RepID=A0A2M6R9C3_9BACT|nr:MAG: UDP-glucose 4-epimerase [Candidatus Berkelbacteria bacterium CG10_big_fil_rev_8_21_14_0_10_43_14]